MRSMLRLMLGGAIVVPVALAAQTMPDGTIAPSTIKNAPVMNAPIVVPTAQPTTVPISRPTPTPTPAPTPAPTPTPTPTRAPWFPTSNGVPHTTLLNMSYMVDFETGATIGTSQTGDLWLEFTDETHAYLAPRNGALIAAGPMAGPYLNGGDCVGRSFSAARIQMPAIPAGQRFCIWTRNGHMAEIAVRSWSSAPTPAGPVWTLRFDWMFWY